MRRFDLIVLPVMCMLIGVFFVGCVNDGNNGTDNGNNIIQNNGADPNTDQNTNATQENETANKAATNKTYHKEYNESISIADAILIKTIDHPFPVKQNATLFSIKITAICTTPRLPDPIDIVGLCVYLYPAGKTGSQDFIHSDLVNGNECIMEMTGKEIESYGYGNWNLQYIGRDVSIIAKMTIDVHYD